MTIFSLYSPKTARIWSEISCRVATAFLFFKK
jgi:hypothetical protein